MNKKNYYDTFFKEKGANVHSCPDRFLKVSELCKGKVLDLACGTGHLADYYLGEYAGIDISEVAISHAREIRRKNAFFTSGDVLSAKFDISNPFDTIYIGEFLEHIESHEKLFERLLKIVKPSGQIIISVPNGNRVPDEDHVRTFTMPEIRKEFSKYGRVQFHNWQGFKERILFSIKLDEKKANDVSLVIIAKDEEKGLETAILSAIEIVDNIVISVDTQTTDKTREIAKLYADEYREHVWADDFSKARNEAQKNVKTKWILFLDGHEYIEKIGDIKSRLMLDIDGILITVKMENGLTFMFPRIYRHEIQFVGAVHNLNPCKKTTACPNFVIIHDRLNLQSKESTEFRTKQRERMLPRIMKQRIKENPADTRALFHLGNYYFMIKEWQLAKKIFKQYLKYSKNNEEKYLMLLNLGICEQMLGQFLRSLWTFDKANKTLPNRFETARLIGGTYFTIGFYRKASKWFVESLGQNSRRYLYEPFPQVFYEIWDLLAMCFVNMNQFEKAVISLEKALENAPDEKLKGYFREKLHFTKMLVKK